MSKILTAVAKTAVVGMLAAGTTATVVSAAFASGTSGKANNCYTQWWNTAWGQKCDSPGASVSGWYYSEVYCDFEPDEDIAVNRPLNSTDFHSGEDCTFDISGGRIWR